MDCHQIISYTHGRTRVPVRAEGYASDLNAGELQRAHCDLAIAQAQAPTGSMAASLIAAYSDAIGTEADRRRNLVDQAGR